MNQSLPQSSIVSGVNEARFLEHLKTLFSTSTTVLAECLQNGRRAGASRVMFDYELDTASLVITDDGSGIADFQTLITVAESGWSEALQESERPFGIGFFSVSFAAEKVRVESRGKQIEFSSEDLIAKRRIAVEPSSFIGGTRITLQQCKLDALRIGNALCAYARGFAIPVHWQGSEIPRPHAQASLVGQQTDVGFVHLPSVHDEVSMGVQLVGVAYCQGLPVMVQDFSSTRDLPNCPVVHLDHLRFTPRMPDRDAIIDGKQAAAAIVAVFKGLWREYLTRRKAELSAAEFAENHWTDARRAGSFDLMVDVPVLPKAILSVVWDYPVLPRCGDSLMNGYRTQISQASVETGEVTVFRDFDETDRGDDFPRLMWAQQAKAIFVSDALPENHWVVPYLQDLAEAPMKISGRVLASEQFEGDWVDGEVKLMADLAVTLNGIKQPLTQAVAVGASDWGASRVFLVPNSSGNGEVVRQASTYTGDNDLYMETDYKMDSKKFDDLVAILAGESGEVTLKRMLNDADATSKSNLRNQTYCVQFDAEGKMTVTCEVKEGVDHV